MKDAKDILYFAERFIGAGSYVCATYSERFKFDADVAKEGVRHFPLRYIKMVDGEEKVDGKEMVDGKERWRW